jgi:DNA-binding transcriptional regulator YiaG
VPEAALLFCRVRLDRKKSKDKAYPKKVTTIGDAIRKRRLELRRQKDLAKIIGYDKTSVLNWEKGHTRPSGEFCCGKGLSNLIKNNRGGWTSNRRVWNTNLVGGENTFSELTTKSSESSMRFRVSLFSSSVFT